MLRRLAHLSLSAWIFIGLGLGLIAGLFFGELCRPLDLVGKAFVMLLQMGVLPYMVVTLIQGVASLSPVDAKLMAGKGSLMLVLFWVVGLIVIFAFSFAFPMTQTSSFFSVSQPTPVEGVRLLGQYIPANIFAALSGALIPSIVFFSVFLGISLLRVPSKEPLMNILSVVAQGLNQMTKMVIKTAPIGVFALTAMAAGTISIDQLQRLEVYFICYILATCVLALWVLPVMVTCFTGFTFKDVLNFSKEALVLGFTTGNNFVVLAVIADKSKELFAKVVTKETRTENVIDSVLPLTYAFPSVGKIIELLFILFVAWYANHSLGILKHLELAFAGVMSLFGSPKVGIPFLLKYMELPGNYFDLYIMADVVTRRFKVLLQTMSMQALTLIVSYLLLRKATVRVRRVLVASAATVVLMAVLVVGTRTVLDPLVQGTYHEHEVLMGMEIKGQAPAETLLSPPQLKEGLSNPADGKEDFLTQITNRGILRVGYDADALPFAFFNSRNELVGYDIYFAHRLAQDLGVSIQFIPAKRGQAQEYLEKGVCDIIMSAFPMRVDNLGKMNFTRPYMEMKSAFIVKDFRKKEFQTRADISVMPGLRVAVTQANSPEDRRLLRNYLPQATLVELDGVKDFFSKADVADALLTTDKIGKAWALLYPEFGVTVPTPHLFVYHVAYPLPIAKGDHYALEYLNHWLTLQQTSGVVAKQFDYWILGKTPQRKTRRWSIIRNVLHWVD